MVGVRNRDAGTDRVTGPEQGAEIGPKGNPEWRYYEVVPAAMTASATATTNLARPRLAGAQRARATALSLLMCAA
jgi:hypothetical protein